MSSAQRAQIAAWLATVEIEPLFRRLDVNGDGFVSEDELHTLCTFGVLSAALCDALLAMGDADADGMLSLAEFLQLGRALQEVEQLKKTALAGAEVEQLKKTALAGAATKSDDAPTVRRRGAGPGVGAFQNKRAPPLPKTKAELIDELLERGHSREDAALAVSRSSSVKGCERWIGQLNSGHYPHLKKVPEKDFRPPVPAKYDERSSRRVLVDESGTVVQSSSRQRSGVREDSHFLPSGRPKNMGWGTDG
eukprot:SAG31_NODE_196_length_20699_cov_103.813835_5_plen_250_part_00